MFFKVNPFTIPVAISTLQVWRQSWRGVVCIYPYFYYMFLSPFSFRFLLYPFSSSLHFLDFLRFFLVVSFAFSYFSLFCIFSSIFSSSLPLFLIFSSSFSSPPFSFSPLSFLFPPLFSISDGFSSPFFIFSSTFSLLPPFHVPPVFSSSLLLHFLFRASPLLLHLFHLFLLLPFLILSTFILFSYFFHLLLPFILFLLWLFVILFSSFPSIFLIPFCLHFILSFFFFFFQSHFFPIFICPPFLNVFSLLSRLLFYFFLLIIHFSFYFYFYLYWLSCLFFIFVVRIGFQSSYIFLS